MKLSPYSISESRYHYISEQTEWFLKELMIEYYREIDDSLISLEKPEDIIADFIQLDKLSTELFENGDSLKEYSNKMHPSKEKIDENKKKLMLNIIRNMHEQDKKEVKFKDILGESENISDEIKSDSSDEIIKTDIKNEL